MSRHYRRLEALPLGWDALSDTQREAVSYVASWLIDALAAIPRGRGDTRGTSSHVPRLDRNRFSQIAFVDGDRGTGKSSVLLTLIDLTTAERFNLPQALADDHPVRLLREQGRRLVWLETLDMEPLSRGANLFAAILARMAQVFDGKLEDLPPFAAALGEPDGAAGVAEGLQQLRNDAAIVWERLDGGSLKGDLQTRALWVNQAERAGLDLTPRIGKVLDGIARTLAGPGIEDPMFVLPVDDFDLAPAHCLELLRLIRAIATPRLFFVVAGNIRIAESVLKLRSEGELARLAGPGSVNSLEMQDRAIEIAANNMRKLVPPGQRARLAELRLKEALAIGRDTPEKSLKERLDMLTFESNQAPTGASTISLAKFLLLDDPLASAATGAVWLAGTPRQVLDCREMLARLETTAIDAETKDVRDDRLVRALLEEVSRQIREDWRLPYTLRERLAGAIDPTASIWLNLAPYLRVEMERGYAPRPLGESSSGYSVPSRIEAAEPQPVLESRGIESASSRSSPRPDSETFDCFLSYDHRDKPAARRLAEALRDRGISVWLDEDMIRPGLPWQQLIESGIQSSWSIVLLVGSSGTGAWQQRGMRAALSMAVRDGRPVIPVLLPDAPAVPDLPTFLSGYTLVDLRSGMDAGLHRLIWGITGRRPEAATSNLSPEAMDDGSDHGEMDRSPDRTDDFQYGVPISYSSLSLRIYAQVTDRELGIELPLRLGAGLIFAHDFAASVWGSYLRHSPLTYRFDVAPLVGALWEKRPEKDLLVIWRTPEWWTFRDFERFAYHWSRHSDQCDGRYGLAWMAAILEVVLDEACQPGASGLTLKRLTGFLNRLMREKPERTARALIRHSAMEVIARLLAPESVSGIEISGFAGFLKKIIEPEVKTRIREARARRFLEALDARGAGTGRPTESKVDLLKSPATPQAAALCATIAPQWAWTRVKMALPDFADELQRRHPNGEYPPTFPSQLVTEIKALSVRSRDEDSAANRREDQPNVSPKPDISQVGRVLEQMSLPRSASLFSEAVTRTLADRKVLSLDILLALAQAASKDHPFNTLLDGALVPTEKDIRRVA